MKDGKYSLFEIYNKAMPRGMHKAAFQGNKLYCPWGGCNNTSFNYVGKQGLFMLLYKCKRCKNLTAYDVSRQLQHPFINNMKKIEV